MSPLKVLCVLALARFSRAVGLSTNSHLASTSRMLRGDTGRSISRLQVNPLETPTGSSVTPQPTIAKGKSKESKPWKYQTEFFSICNIRLTENGADGNLTQFEYAHFLFHFCKHSPQRGAACTDKGRNKKFADLPVDMQLAFATSACPTNDRLEKIDCLRGLNAKGKAFSYKGEVSVLCKATFMLMESTHIIKKVTLAPSQSLEPTPKPVHTHFPISSPPPTSLPTVLSVASSSAPSVVPSKATSKNDFSTKAPSIKTVRPLNLPMSQGTTNSTDYSKTRNVALLVAGVLMVTIVSTCSLSVYVNRRKEQKAFISSGPGIQGNPSIESEQSKSLSFDAGDQEKRRTICCGPNMFVTTTSPTSVSKEDYEMNKAIEAILNLSAKEGASKPAHSIVLESTDATIYKEPLAQGEDGRPLEELFHDPENILAEPRTFVANEHEAEVSSKPVSESSGWHKTRREWRKTEGSLPFFSLFGEKVNAEKRNYDAVKAELKKCESDLNSDNAITLHTRGTNISQKTTSTGSSIDTQVRRQFREFDNKMTKGFSSLMELDKLDEVLAHSKLEQNDCSPTCSMTCDSTNVESDEAKELPPPLCASGSLTSVSNSGSLLLMESWCDRDDDIMVDRRPEDCECLVSDDELKDKETSMLAMMSFAETQPIIEKEHRQVADINLVDAGLARDHTNIVNDDDFKDMESSMLAMMSFAETQPVTNDHRHEGIRTYIESLESEVDDDTTEDNLISLASACSQQVPSMKGSTLNGIPLESEASADDHAATDTKLSETAIIAQEESRVSSKAVSFDKWIKRPSQIPRLSTKILHDKNEGTTRPTAPASTQLGSSARLPSPRRQLFPARQVSQKEPPTVATTIAVDEAPVSTKSMDEGAVASTSNHSTTQVSNERQGDAPKKGLQIPMAVETHGAQTTLEQGKPKTATPRKLDFLAAWL
jgi:hypothetical protein